MYTIFYLYSVRDTESSEISCQTSYFCNLIMGIWIPHFRAKSAYFYLPFVFLTWNNLKCHWLAFFLNNLLCDVFQGHFLLYIYARVMCFLYVFLGCSWTYIFFLINLVLFFYIAGIGSVVSATYVDISSIWC